jgi:DNA polymerase III epsilon subunit-like protein
MTLKRPKYVALDTETTGLDHHRHAIIEIAAMALDHNFKPIDEGDFYQTLVRPFSDAVIDDGALNVNNHWWAKDPTSDGFKKAKDPADAWEGLYAYLKQHYVPADKEDGKPHMICLVGWNPAFDEAFLREMHSHYHSRGDVAVKANAAYVSRGWPFHYHKIDFLSICRYLDARHNRVRRSYKLEHVAAYYFGEGLMKLAAHSALGDVKLTLEVLEAMEKDDRRDLELVD